MEIIVTSVTVVKAERTNIWMSLPEFNQISQLIKWFLIPVLYFLTLQSSVVVFNEISFPFTSVNHPPTMKPFTGLRSILSLAVSFSLFFSALSLSVSADPKARALLVKSLSKLVSLRNKRRAKEPFEILLSVCFSLVLWRLCPAPGENFEPNGLFVDMAECVCPGFVWLRPMRFAF